MLGVEKTGVKWNSFPTAPASTRDGMQHLTAGSDLTGPKLKSLISLNIYYENN